MAEGAEPLVERLIRLSFSQYEARAYVGLLVHGEQTGYRLAKLTGVPQPKIYETLHRLVDTGGCPPLRHRQRTGDRAGCSAHRAHSS